jgi:type IV secretory pathway VirB10-like protein
MYKWTQIGGSPFVILSNNNTATPIFNAPLDIPADTTLTLQFSVIDNHGLIGTDTLNVLVKDIPPPPPPPPPLAPPAELEEEEEEDAAAADEEEEDAAAADEEEDAAAADEEEDDTGLTELFGPDEDEE